MERTLSPLPAIFVPFECITSIFKHLPRESLKSLRLTCKEMADLVSSPASHLFSRVYVSVFRRDLEVLDEVCNYPRIARCVRELVWDTLQPFDGDLSLPMPPDLKGSKHANLARTLVTAGARQYPPAG
ncbi:hypothetical protein AJ80_02171 [Polytolypa hystricis UAMH7299]|uniref:F-box domain-containing protein n=1 Tax=Polytolypa hystricis (strain UAMH7299) TaxID=1447883 RepID=A0A2B7YSA0_POLH7|nr:hypothetical protein AJ80_02171 [Polytolypa hystricis UAMH7299]